MGKRNMQNITNLKNILKGSRINEPLSKHTFLKIGGPADLYYEANTSDELIGAYKNAADFKIPVTILGWGSNILVSDKGVRGLVIVNLSKEIKMMDLSKENFNKENPVSRWESDNTQGTFKYEFKDLDYSEKSSKRIDVRIDSGVGLANAREYLYKYGITGFQWYAGIPGTIGGAVFNNIHGGTHFISEVIKSVKVITPGGEVKELSIDEVGVDYDKSRFHKSKEIIVSVLFSLFLGDVDRAKYVTNEWEKRKNIQPRNSPGCAFQNITQEQKLKLGFPTTSVGYIVEHELKMTDFRVGDAAISANHHNFIVNLGNATASDYLKVVKEIYRRTKVKLGIELVPEIFFMGFEDEEIKEFKTDAQKNLMKARKHDIKTVYADSRKLFSKC
jgi:UDP-N-acetylmuramate dehydrogenase